MDNTCYDFEFLAENKVCRLHSSFYHIAHGHHVHKFARYKLKNMIHVGIIPGPEASKDVWSFLQPTIRELQVLQDTGMTVHLPQATIQCRIHLLYIDGDVPAIGKLIGHHHGQVQSWCISYDDVQTLMI